MVDTIGLLLAWGLVALIQAGWGSLTLRLSRAQDGYTVSAAFWTGLASMLGFLQLWHLVQPITAGAKGLVVVIGLVGLAGRFAPLRAGLATASKERLWAAVATALALLLANHALQAPVLYDNGLYHLQAVQWAERFAIVPGLGNLHGRLAFNSAYFLSTALWEDFVWRYSGAQLINGALTFALACEGLSAVWRTFTARRLTVVLLLDILLLYPLINLVFDPLAAYLSGPTTDYIVWILTLKLGSAAFRYLCEHEGLRSAGEIAALAAALVTVKLSGALFAVGMLALVLIKASQRQPAVARRMLATAALWFLLLVAPWAVRNTILSGYIVYPATVGMAPVDWRISEAQAQDDANYVRSWARYPVAGTHWRQVLSNWEWFPTWQVNFWRTRGIRMSIAAGTAAWGVAALAAWRWGQGRDTMRIALFWSIPSLANLLFWFFTAPDPRFALAYFWLVSLGGVVALFDSVPHLPKFFQRALPHQVTAVGLAAGVVVFSLFSKGLHWRTAIEANPTVEVAPYRTASGLRLNVPVGGELCWDAPVPCTPHPKPELRLRDASDPGAGFTVFP